MGEFDTLECRLNNPDDINNVQVINLSPTEIQKMMQNSTLLEVKITRRSLSTSKQPFSIVITGGFEYNSVLIKTELDTNTTINYNKSFFSKLLGSSSELSDFEEAVAMLICCCLYWH